MLNSPNPPSVTVYQVQTIFSFATLLVLNASIHMVCGMESILPTKKSPARPRQPFNLYLPKFVKLTRKENELYTMWGAIERVLISAVGIPTGKNFLSETKVFEKIQANIASGSVKAIPLKFINSYKANASLSALPIQFEFYDKKVIEKALDIDVDLHIPIKSLGVAFSSINFSFYSRLHWRKPDEMLQYVPEEDFEIVLKLQIRIAMKNSGIEKSVLLHRVTRLVPLDHSSFSVWSFTLQEHFFVKNIHLTVCGRDLRIVDWIQLAAGLHPNDMTNLSFDKVQPSGIVDSLTKKIFEQPYSPRAQGEQFHVMNLEKLGWKFGNAQNVAFHHSTLQRKNVIFARCNFPVLLDHRLYDFDHIQTKQLARVELSLSTICPSQQVCVIDMCIAVQNFIEDEMDGNGNDKYLPVQNFQHCIANTHFPNCMAEKITTVLTLALPMDRLLKISERKISYLHLSFRCGDTEDGIQSNCAPVRLTLESLALYYIPYQDGMIQVSLKPEQRKEVPGVEEVPEVEEVQSPNVNTFPERKTLAVSKKYRSVTKVIHIERQVINDSSKGRRKIFPLTEHWTWAVLALASVATLVLLLGMLIMTWVIASVRTLKFCRRMSYCQYASNELHRANFEHFGWRAEQWLTPPLPRDTSQRQCRVENGRLFPRTQVTPANVLARTSRHDKKNEVTLGLILEQSNALNQNSSFVKSTISPKKSKVSKKEKQPRSVRKKTKKHINYPDSIKANICTEDDDLLNSSDSCASI